ncbi:hypothetical protein JVU11DRAFT_6418 [Chiua virens]|nr:hypothetical protein JVU11DRAFT_6418 [Chiua virens]
MFVFRSTTLLLSLLHFLTIANALHFYLDANEKRCFIEELPSDTVVEGHYRALEWQEQAQGYALEPNLGMVVEVEEMETGHSVVQTRGPPDSRFTFTSHESGDHQICLSTNYTSWWSSTHIKLYLDIVVGKTKADVEHDRSHVSELASKVRDLNQKLEDIRREQQYQRERESDFRNLSEATNSKAVWYIEASQGRFFGLSTCEVLTMVSGIHSDSSRRELSSISKRDDADDAPSLARLPSPAEDTLREVVRPSIDYSSFGAWAHSVWARWKSLWTKSFIFSFVAGQVVSLCITVTNVTTTELVSRNWSIPTTQTWFLYFSLFLIYTPYTMYQYGFRGWGRMVLRDGWKYFFLACCDVEGNFLVVKAYNYTDLLSCMLLDAWAIPVCLLFCWVYMRTRYHWTQVLGVLVCVAGLGLLVTSDMLTDKNYPALSKGKGDAFMIIGATLYGFTNATEEFFVRRRPLYEVVGQMGMWGTIVNGIQASALEHGDWFVSTWDGPNAMFILYTTAPMLYRSASSAFYNISLLTSDFYGLLFGLFLFHYSPFWLYFPAFAVVIAGLIVYFWHATPEEQGNLDPQRPDYVRSTLQGEV